MSKKHEVKLELIRRANALTLWLVVFGFVWWSAGWKVMAVIFAIQWLTNLLLISGASAFIEYKLRQRRGRA